jgi:hypothetical protein
LQTIQIDDYEENEELDLSLHQESTVDPEPNPSPDSSSTTQESNESKDDHEEEQKSNLESDSSALTDSVNESDSELNVGISDRSTETITAPDFSNEEKVAERQSDDEVRPRETEADLLTTLEDAERQVVKFLVDSKYVEAVQTYRKLKTRWPNVVSEVIVGVPSIADDVWAILTMYCNELSGTNLSDDAASFFAMTVTDVDLADHCGRLMDASMQVRD